MKTRNCRTTFYLGGVCLGFFFSLLHCALIYDPYKNHVEADSVVDRLCICLGFLLKFTSLAYVICIIYTSWGPESSKQLA